MKQSEVIRKAVQTDPAAKGMRAEMAAGQMAKSPAGGAMPINTLHADIREVFHRALGDVSEPQFDEVAINQRAKLRDAGLDPDTAPPEGYRRLAPEEWQKVKEETRTKLARLKKEIEDKIQDRLGDFKERNPSLVVDDPNGALEKMEARFGNELLNEKNESGLSYRDRIKELRDLVGRDPQRSVYVSKGKPVIEDGVVKPAGPMGELTKAFTDAVFGKNSRKIATSEEFLRRATELSREADVLNDTSKQLRDKIVEGKRSTEGGFIGEGPEAKEDVPQTE
jgi:hypothetical protein